MVIHVVLRKYSTVSFNFFLIIIMQRRKSSVRNGVLFSAILMCFTVTITTYFLYGNNTDPLVQNKSPKLHAVSTSTLPTVQDNYTREPGINIHLARREILSETHEGHIEPMLQKNTNHQLLRWEMLLREQENHTQQTDRTSSPILHITSRENSTTTVTLTNKQMVSEVTEPPHRSGLGYWFALHYSDQGTGSFINIMSFLCLAKELGGIRVVEPFLIGSDYGQILHTRWSTDTTFGDVFDSATFDQYVASKNYSSLVPFDEFLEDAPRKMLVAQYQCSGMRCKPCGHDDVLQRGRIFSKLNGFEMVGHVCLQYGLARTMSVREMEKQLYAEYNRSEVVIMFIRFGGVAKGIFTKMPGYRLYLGKSPCYRANFTEFSKMRPSRFVMASANKYIKKYLNSERYISVMVRIQMLLGSKSKVKSRRAKHLTENCLSHLYQRISELKSIFGINKIFPCLDVGDYGSNIFRSEEYMSPLLPHFDKFISRTVKEGMSLLQWDATFSDVTLRQDPGFVAVMQKVIASRGDILVMVGSESVYQASTRKMYETLHTPRERKVFALDKECTILLHLH